MSKEERPLQGKKTARVIHDHSSDVARPLALRAGQPVTVGRRDEHWSKWVWCTTSMGLSGWVPETYVERHQDRWVARCDYDATELAVRRGEVVTIEREESDWLWCVNERGESGWVPAEKLATLPAGVNAAAAQVSDCPFCQLPPERIIADDDLVLAVRDLYPVVELHTLIIPKRHVSSYFDLEPAEVEACHRLLRCMKDSILSRDESVTGFNVGINVGQTAGQTVWHCHIHLVPRRKGDVPRPRGGVRHIIPGKGFYRTDR